ncbi:hypothetical protein [Nocardiopsis lambiniae]|uniref:Uncharacterized protein n=1 Tax=Nocardiopsis lambiniae TaxID=3075539 RepID=A0ABU2M974_9ACTN|nr:hypothetical protein [Nocardiopsis sp. DSM 44743]MDT0329223.1 hypothetical protein [Nocardiopsis sp. DSM 44743]
MTTAPPGPMRRVEQAEETARVLLSVAPQGWREMVHRVVSVGGFSHETLSVVDADGAVSEAWIPRAVSDAVAGLKRACHRKGEGTWTSLEFTVAPSGRFGVSYDRDAEPTLPSGVAPVVFRQELERFPRDEEHVPGWWRERLEQARSVDVDALYAEYAELVAREFEAEGGVVGYRPPTSLQVLTRDGRLILRQDLREEFERAVAEPGALGSAAAGFAASVFRRVEGGGPAVEALVAAFARLGARASLGALGVVRVVFGNGRREWADVEGFCSAFGGLPPEELGREAAAFVRERTRWWDRRGARRTVDGGGFAGRWRVRLLRGPESTQAVRERAQVREVAPGLWQGVVLEGPGAEPPPPVDRAVFAWEGRSEARVFAEAVESSVNEPVRVRERGADGTRLLCIGGEHPYVAAQAYVLPRYAGEMPHGAVVMFPTPYVMYAHPLGQGSPVTAMQVMNAIADRLVGVGDPGARSAGRLYWWHPSAWGRNLGRPPEPREVGVRVDHVVGEATLLTSDEEFDSLVRSLV